MVLLAVPYLYSIVNKIIYEEKHTLTYCMYALYVLVGAAKRLCKPQVTFLEKQGHLMINFGLAWTSGVFLSIYPIFFCSVTLKAQYY